MNTTNFASAQAGYGTGTNQYAVCYSRRSRRIFSISSHFLVMLLLLAGQKLIANPGVANNWPVAKIEISGNKKIETDAIRAKIESKIKQPAQAMIIREDVKRIYATGYFDRVEVFEVLKNQAQQKVLVFELKEKPSIKEIRFEGNAEVEDSELLESVGIKAFEILDQSKVQVAAEKLAKLYEEKGFFLANIRPEIEKVASSAQGVENVILTFKIQENDMVKVKSIRLVGAKKIDANRLKGVMQTQEGGFFSSNFDTGGNYQQDTFDRDLEILRFYYFNEGYVQVKIERPQVSVTTDKLGIYITIEIDEGEAFDVGSVDFSGDLLFEESELFSTVEIDETGRYKHQTLLKDLEALQAKYGDLGYAYANIIPRTQIREKDRKVDITFEVDKGQKVHIGRINVVGNTKTRDKVVRRELLIQEGELYHETRKRESLANVKRLGFFEEVNFTTSSPEGRPQIMDIDIVVKERNTGTIQLGAGYSDFQGFQFNGTIQQSNLMGRGQNLGASLNIGRQESIYNLSFTEPYLFESNWEAGFNVYQRNRRVIQSNFDERKRGGSITVGHPLAPFLRGFLTYKLDETELELDPDDGDPDLFPVETANGVTSSITVSVVYDERDDRLQPSKGLFTRTAVEYAGVGGDLDYTKGTANLRYYKSIFSGIILRNNLVYGIVASNDSGAEPPFNELFLLGGANSLRGYDWFTVGKRKKSNVVFDRAIAANDPNPEITALRPFGGRQQIYYNLELQFPLVGEAGLNGVTFYDVGYADDVLRLEDLRSNYGFGVRWFSPIGPLRFEWGFPIARKAEFFEKSTNFQFAIGTPF